MDGKLGTFLLGVIAAVVLYMLWDKSNHHTFSFPSMAPGPSNGSSDFQPTSNCGSCGGSGVTGYSSPVGQAQLDSVGIGGQISPSAAPLNAATGGQGATSFYSNDGVTPDTGFTFIAVPRNTNPSAVGTPAQPGGLQGNVPGSPTTIAATTPVRATQVVPPYSVGGFHQNYNILGVPLKVLQSRGYLV